MKKLPLRKAKREINRLGRQIRGAHRYFANWLAGRVYYDLLLARSKKVFTGAVPLSPRVAIYLIFPQGGMQASHLAALDYLRRAGYAPLVVSNLPLSDTDRTTLISRAARIVVRPNFGYDFGGYRDAILDLGREELKRLDRLVLTNDSSWFPLPGAPDWLAEAEALGVDYAAASWHGAVAPRDPETYEEIRWTVAKSRRNFHYASFALSLSPRILSHPGFWRFWKGFRLTNEKHRTVRRGEIGLTRWVMRQGFSHRATTELDRLDTDLAQLGDAALDAVFRRTLLISDPQTTRRWEAALGLTEGRALSRRQKEQAILALTAREGAVYALADYLMRHRGFAFLKKSPTRHNARTSAIVIAAIESLEGPLAETILREARGLSRG